MLILMTAAIVAAQPASAPASAGQLAPIQHEQPGAAKEDCCKECCKDMAAKQEGHGTAPGGNPAR